MQKAFRVLALTVSLVLSLACHNYVFAAAEQEKLTICTYYPTPSGTYNQLTTTGNTYLATSGTGNVGIGTTAPQGLLQAGTSPASGLIVGLVVNSAGMVGVGTTASATERLYVQGDMYVANSNVGGYTGTISLVDFNNGDPRGCDFDLQGGVIMDIHRTGSANQCTMD